MTTLLSSRELAELMQQQGLRVTDPRMRVLRELDYASSPLSHRELTERLNRRSPLDRATVYRSLLTLTGAGVVVRTALGDGVWRFELPRSGSASHRSHPHFVCNGCGDVVCLSPDEVVFTGDEAVRKTICEIRLRGLCLSCATAVAE